VFASHSRRVSSVLCEAIFLPSGEKIETSTIAWWPVSWSSSLPVAKSQTRTV
jgi:hypothetical protein